MDATASKTNGKSGGGNVHYEIADVKAAAVGRTVDILRDVAGIPAEYLDGRREHPCPKCGGDTRFRLVDAQAGAVRCNQCFQAKCGDFLAAVTWMKNMSFPEAIAACGKYLGVFPAKNGSPSGDALMAEFCDRKRINMESLKAYGAKASTRGKAHTICVPMRDQDGEPTGHQDYGLTGELSKGLTNRGGKAGLFFPGLWPEPGDDVIICEGVKDAAALHSLGYKLAVGTPGTIFRRAWASVFSGCRVILIPDRDEASRKFFAGVQKMLVGVAKSVGWVELPFEETKTGGKDVRDLLATDNGEAKLSALIADAAINATSTKNDRMKASTDPQQCQTIEPGTRVYATDKGNYGTVVADHGQSCTVHFCSPDGQEADVELPKSSLRTQDGFPIDPSAGIDIGPPVSLGKIIQTNPNLRPPVIDGLLRQGETMNIIAAPKQGKSWLAAGLALAVADGFDWLGTFGCHQGRVLIIDAELHPETIAHRLPMAAEAAGASTDYTDRIDVWTVRGKGVDLLGLGPAIAKIPEDQYSLVILDAWYRFLPPGISENDNAAIMSLYNTIDGYSGRLNAAWGNVHHASKGDQSQKGVTDVGSGAGSQSRAADAHLIIRPHEEEGVAVIEAVVRSFPPVDRLAIRFDFPAWFLDRQVDPRAIRKPRERSSREDKDRHLDADRQAIINAMVAAESPQTKTFIRDTARVSNPRFGFAWASLLNDGTITPSEDKVIKGNGRTYEGFVIAEIATGQQPDNASG